MPVLFEPLPGRAGTLVVMENITVRVGEIIKHDGKLQFHFYSMADQLSLDQKTELNKVVMNHISITNRLMK